MKRIDLKSKKTIIKTIAITTIASAVIAVCSLVVYAYFSSKVILYTDDGQKEVFSMGLELNTFFDMLDGDAVTKGTSLGIPCDDSRYRENAKLEEDGNYYYKYDSNAEWGSASNPYIISRKAHLQNLYVLQNCGYFKQYISGASEASLPYFLVCNTDGTPANIDCTDATIEPIGNEIYPFIGYFGGAFVTGSVSVNGNTSDQSVIYNATIQTTEDVIDVGLFGHIGYKGTFASDGKTVSGIASTVSNVLLYDVTVKVEKSHFTVLDKIVEALKTHFLYFRSLKLDGTANTENDNNNIPHENHHIGILAGHVELASVNLISVYYSDSSIAAIDVSYDSTTYLNGNFKSISGILGFCYEMNSEQADGVITVGGTSNEDIEVSGGGVGTGGGLESGLGRGYVTATEIYGAYHDSGEIVKCTIPIIEHNPDGTNYTSYIYKYGLVILMNPNNQLEYGDGNTTICSLQDEITPVNVHKPDGKDTYVATIYSSYENFFGVTQTSSQDWYEFVIYDVANKEYKYYEEGSNTLTTVSNVESTGISMRDAAKHSTNPDEFKRLCTQYERNRIGSSITGWTQTTDRCYFYDGVFTFALSDPTDTIEKTWDCDSEDDVDTFYVGDDDASKWKTITTEGNKAIVSYVKQLTTVSEVNAAAKKGKSIYLIYENINEDGSKSEYLVTLAENSKYSAGNGEDALYTYYTSLDFVDEEMREQLKTNVASGTISSPIEGVSNADLVKNWDNYKILNVGSSTDSTMSLTKLRTYYNIDIAYVSAEPSSSYIDEYGDTFSHSNVTVSEGTGIVETFTKQWDGYWQWHQESTSYNWATWYYTVFEYVSASTGDVVYSYGSRTTTGDKWEVGVTAEEYFGTGVTKFGATVYTKNGYTGRVFYINQTINNYYNEGFSRTTGSRYAGYGSKANMSISNYSELTNFFVAYITDDGTTYKLNATGNLLSNAPSIATDSNVEKKKTIGGTTYTLYTDGTNEGILLTINSSNGYYSFSSNRDGVVYTLRMLRRAYPAASRYSIMCATDTYADGPSNFKNEFNNTPSVTSSKNATVVSSGDGNTFYISYQINGNTRYLAFGTSVAGAGENDSSGSCFHGVRNTSDACKIYIYTVEGSQDVNYGRVTYQPSSSSTYNKTYNASQYVLWPNQVYDSEDDTTSTYKPGSTTAYTADPTYSIMELSSQTLLNWKTSTGFALKYDDLCKVFNLGDGISNINILNLWGGESATNFDSEYIKAPVGTDGEETFIPTGCVAFRVNESSSNNKIRVIVAVPYSEYYYGQSVAGSLMNPDAVDYSKDYYFCMWQIESSTSGSATSITLDNCKQAFEIPRSNPYKPGTTASSVGEYIYDSNISGTGAASANSVKNYIQITENGNTYRSYLNGSEVLIAYEFTASEEGVYALGSNHECRIVFFSADATASAGKDGTESYKMGTIDFVYANNENKKIITVGNGDPDVDGSYDYDTYYYPSLALLYTDNGANANNGPLRNDTDLHTAGGVQYPNINNFIIKVQRRRTSSASEIVWTAYGNTQLQGGIADAAYLQFVRYSYFADPITRNADSLRE